MNGTFNTTGGSISGAPMCFRCGAMIWTGTLHTCAPGVAYQWINPPSPTPLYTIQCCPVCEGRMTVPAGFYSRMGVSGSLNPETCQTYDGKGVLKVGLCGSVEKVI